MIESPSTLTVRHYLCRSALPPDHPDYGTLQPSECEDEYSDYVVQERSEDPSTDDDGTTDDASGPPSSDGGNVGSGDSPDEVFGPRQ